MLRYLIAPRIERAVARYGRSRVAPALTAALAFLFTVSMSVPVTAIVVPAVVLAQPRRKAVVAFAALGSALGATLLVAIFHHWGWDQVYAAFPEMRDSASWLRVTKWVARWGVPALFVVAALPLPQTPGLVFLALARHGEGEVFVAILAGKLIKYGVVAAAVAAFPDRFRLPGNASDRATGHAPPASG